MYHSGKRGNIDIGGGGESALRSSSRCFYNRKHSGVHAEYRRNRVTPAPSSRARIVLTTRRRSQVVQPVAKRTVPTEQTVMHQLRAFAHLCCTLLFGGEVDRGASLSERIYVFTASTFKWC